MLISFQTEDKKFIVGLVKFICFIYLRGNNTGLSRNDQSAIMKEAESCLEKNGN